jgi:hypothetical protein
VRLGLGGLKATSAAMREVLSSEVKVGGAGGILGEGVPKNGMVSEPGWVWSLFELDVSTLGTCTLGVFTLGMFILDAAVCA